MSHGRNDGKKSCYWVRALSRKGPEQIDETQGGGEEGRVDFSYSPKGLPRQSDLGFKRRGEVEYSIAAGD